MSRRGKQQTNIEELKSRIQSLSPMGIRFVARLIDSLSSPPRADITGSWITSNPDWVEYFGLTISVHHSNTIEPSRVDQLRGRFPECLRGRRMEAGRTGIGTRRFVDAIVLTTGIETVTKSTAARRLSATTAHISKLTEAAWIQDVRSARARRSKTLELFRQYRAAVDAIIMLRAFRSGRDVIPTKYQLIEIPTAIFASLDDAPQSAFAADGPTVDCPYGNEPVAARVSLDRSDG